jgi:DNA-binding GntR family transcriptional regulator
MRIIRDLWESRPSFSPIKQKSNLVRSVAEHTEMIQASRVGDAARLEQLVHRHIKQAADQWSAFLAARSE